MDKENVLIRSEADKRFRVAFLLLGILGIILFLIGYSRYSSNLNSCREYLSLDYSNGRAHLWWRYSLLQVMLFQTTNGGRHSVAPFLDLGLLLFLVGGILFFACIKMRIIVSDKRVSGSSFFGRSVDLPADQISAVGKSWMKGISVATSSGKIKFLCINNRDEIYRVITGLLLDRQKRPASPEAQAEPATPSSAADELKKYKELLDLGAITREEYDAKKKQLLGI